MMWQPTSYGAKTEHSPLRNSGNVIDLTSPPSAQGPGMLKQSQELGKEEEDEFPYNLSQDSQGSTVSFAIRHTPGLEPDEEFEQIKYEPDLDDAPAVNASVKRPPVATDGKVNRATLNEEQREAANMAIYGRKNIFLTGAAGTGKSYLLRFIIQQLKARRKGDVFVTATTGVAAENIKGTTLHSFAGIGLGEGTVDMLFRKVQGSKPAKGRWKKVKYLIVDEVSMLHVDLFEKLEELARKMKCYKREEKPFGGIKLILCGDFFQLPPVDRKRSGNKYAFQSPIWTEYCDIQTVALREVHRQTDNSFVNLLNEVRIGQFTAKTRAQLDACHITVKPIPKDGILPTKLYCLNKNVDAENLYYLNKLPHPDFVYNGSDRWVPKGQESRGDDGYESNVDANFEDLDPQGRANMMADVDRKAPISIRLRVGAQVMYVRNDPQLGLVNGSRGVVTELADHSPTVKFDNGTTVVVKMEKFAQYCNEGRIVRDYMPLKLAWALTVHKSQGMTLTRVELQLDNAFECGQVYVALSRVQSLPGLFIRGGRITPDLVRADENVLATFGPQGSFRTQHSVNESSSEASKRKREAEFHQQPYEQGSSWMEENGDHSDDSDASDVRTENGRKKNRKASKKAKHSKKHQRDEASDYEDFRRASSGSSSGGDSSSSSSSSSRRRGSGGAPEAPVDVIDLISPDRIQLAAQRVLQQDACESDAFQRLVQSNSNHVNNNHNSYNYTQPSQFSQDAPRAARDRELAYGPFTQSTQPLPADFEPTQSTQSSQNGPFSGTFTQLRDQAYQTHPIYESRSTSSSSFSASVLPNANTRADDYWRSKDTPHRVGGIYAPYQTYGVHNEDGNRDQWPGTSSRVDPFAAATEQFHATLNPLPPATFTTASKILGQAAARVSAPSVPLAVPVAAPVAVATRPVLPAPAPVAVSAREPPRVAAPSAAAIAAAQSRPASQQRAIMYFDGGALGNPGVGGAGYLLYPDTAQPPHVQPTVPFAQAAVRMHGADCTNNQAEYTGLIHGLQAALAQGVRVLTVYGDSELVIKQMKGEYKVKNPVLKGMNQRAQQLACSFSTVSYIWVKRECNKPADALSSRAMHQPATAEECAVRIG